MPGYSIDDYGLVLHSAPDQLFYAQGRFVSLGLLRLLTALEVDPRHARVVFATLSIAALAAVGTLVARHWRVTRGKWLPVAVAAIVANHPFTVEIFTFRSALAAFAMPLLVMALLLVPRRWTPGLVAAGALIFAVALGVYQIVLQFAGMILLGGWAIDAARAVAAGAPALRWVPRDVGHRRTGLLTACALGTSLYVLVTAVAARLAGVATGGNALLPPGEIEQRWLAVVRVFQYRLLSGSPLSGLTVLRVQQALLAVALLAVLWRIASSRRRRGRAAVLGVAVLGLFAACVFWTVGLVAVMHGWWPSPRAMAHSGVFWAAVVAVASHTLGRPLRMVVSLLSALLLFSYLGINNRALQDQWRLNVRDLLKARSIISRLEALPGFATVDQIALHGAEGRYAVPYATADMDLNSSAFGPWYSTVWLLVESSGHALRPADDPTVAARFCSGREPWPAAGSVGVEGRVAVVCLGD